MMRLALLFLIGWLPLFSATIPSFPISGITPGKVSFSNGSTFEVVVEGYFPILDWDLGDLVVLSQPTWTLLPEKISNNGGVLVVRMPVSMHNESKNIRVIGFLEIEATMQTMGTRAIQSIDRSQRKITMDDSSAWIYPSVCDALIETWGLGDLVMVGSSHVFDGSLINVSRGTLISVME